MKFKAKARRWSREPLPVFLVLAFSIIFHFYGSDTPFPGNGRVVYRILLRFFRYTFFLCLPLVLVKPI